jgi:integrase
MNGKYEGTLERYLENLDKDRYHTTSTGIQKAKNHTKIDTHNANLLRNFAEQYKALPSCKSALRVLTATNRMKSVADMIGKPLDELTEKDLQTLNIRLKEKNIVYPSDFRSTLKKFLKMLNKKKYIDLIESDFLSETGTNDDRVLVDAKTFFNQEECERYLIESKKHSPRQLAFASIWLTAGLRPGEILALTKSMFELRENNLLIRVPKVKTKARTVVLSNGQAQTAWKNLDSHLTNLGENEKLFPITWAGQYKVHRLICERAKVSKTKDWTMYMSRKMSLTRFYNEYGLVKACQMAGHVPGSKIMKHYVNLTEEQLLEGTQLVKIETKMCPNPECNTENEAYVTQCYKCKSPLDKQAFATIISNNIDDKINAQLEIIKKDFMIKMLTMQTQQKI